MQLEQHSERADSWPNAFSSGEIKISQVLIEFSTHELITPHMSKQTSALLSLPCPYSVITTHPHETLPAKSASPERQLLLISDDGVKREKDRKKDMRTSLEHVRLWDNGWLSPFGLPGKLPHIKLNPAPSTFSLASVQLFNPIKQEKPLYASLFLLETSIGYTSVNLCFTLLKN